MSKFTESIRIAAAPEVVWSALADIGNIYEWNPGVKHSSQTSQGEVGVGATRHCDLGGRNYLDEEVIVFDPYRSLTIRITSTNLPFKSADIQFTLREEGSSTMVTVSPNYELKFGMLGSVLDSLLVRGQYRKGMRGLLEGLKIHIEGR